MSRDLSELTPETQALYSKFDAKMKEVGIDYIVTCTYRSQAEQDALFAQGRTTPGRIVTWAQHSKHTERTAFDIAIKKDDKAIWDTKVDVNDNDIPDYIEAGKIGESVGLEWGGSWSTKKKDFPHFQLPE
jgi:peptidoglycan LD-endopeptidase CwlK